MRRNLAGYVTMTADGNGAVIVSAGFELARLPEPQPAVTRPVDFKAVRGAHTGEVELIWRTVRTAGSYVVEMITADPSLPGTEWTSVAITTKVKIKFERLSIGQYYYYRVKAVGRNNESPFSDVSLVMTAAA